MSKHKVATRSINQPEHLDEIVLGGTKVTIRGTDIPLSGARLDPKNPRVANTVALSGFGTGVALQKRLREQLWEDPDVHDLYRSVLENRGLVERIIVRADGTIAEGNCRWVVYNKLHENYPTDATWRFIPARLLPENITEKQVAILLGELHVGGKNQWSAFEKAGHIYSLFSVHGMVQDEIARLLRTSKTAVNHNVRAFDAMKNKYLRSYPGPGAIRKFSHFLELYKKPELRDWVSNSPDALDQFVRWVGTNKLPRGEDVRGLKDIVSNPKALSAFSEHGFEAAQKVLEKDRPELTSTLFRLMIEMTEALKDARLDEIQKVRKDKSGHAKAIVRNLHQSLDRFIDLCDGID
jgi:hypothetical protein